MLPDKDAAAGEIDFSDHELVEMNVELVGREPSAPQPRRSRSMLRVPVDEVPRPLKESLTLPSEPELAAPLVAVDPSDDVVEVAFGTGEAEALVPAFARLAADGADDGERRSPSEPIPLGLDDDDETMVEIEAEAPLVAGLAADLAGVVPEAVAAEHTPKVIVAPLPPELAPLAGVRTVVAPPPTGALEADSEPYAYEASARSALPPLPAERTVVTPALEPPRPLPLEELTPPSTGVRVGTLPPALAALARAVTSPADENGSWLRPDQATVTPSHGVRALDDAGEPAVLLRGADGSAAPVLPARDDAALELDGAELEEVDQTPPPGPLPQAPAAAATQPRAERPAPPPERARTLTPPPPLAVATAPLTGTTTPPSGTATTAPPPAPLAGITATPPPAPLTGMTTPPAGTPAAASSLVGVVPVATPPPTALAPPAPPSSPGPAAPPPLAPPAPAAPTALTAAPPPPPAAPAPPPPATHATPPAAHVTPHAAPPPPPVAPVAAPAVAHAPPPPPPAAPPPPPATGANGETALRGRRKRRAKQWYEEIFDDDYLRTLPQLTARQTEREAEFVAESLALPAGASVLDLACGYGRHAMELAARGYQVTGLDLSLPLLIRAADAARRLGVNVNFVHGDMRETSFEDEFDAAYCVFTSFGYFDDDTNRKVAANLARAIKPGGKLLLEVVNRDYLVRDLPTRVWWQGEGCVVLEEVDFNYFSSRLQVQRSIIFEDGRQAEQEISIRAYSLHEIGKVLHHSGFRVTEVSGGLSLRGKFFGAQSRQLLVLAEKKPNP